MLCKYMNTHTLHIPGAERLYLGRSGPVKVVFMSSASVRANARMSECFFSVNFGDLGTFLHDTGYSGKDVLATKPLRISMATRNHKTLINANV